LERFIGIPVDIIDLDICYKNPSFIHRLKKYVKRGFKISSNHERIKMSKYRSNNLHFGDQVLIRGHNYVYSFTQGRGRTKTPYDEPIIKIRLNGLTISDGRLPLKVLNNMVISDDCVIETNEWLFECVDVNCECLKDKLIWLRRLNGMSRILSTLESSMEQRRLIHEHNHVNI